MKDLINKPFSHFETVVLNDETVLEDAPVEDNSEEEEKEEVFVEVVEVPTEVIEETAEIVKEESVVVAEEHIQVVEEVIETTEQPVREKEIQVDQTEPVIQIEESEQFVEAPVVLSGEVKQPVTEVITPVDELSLIHI